jgi:hypothetical protein
MTILANKQLQGMKESFTPNRVDSVGGLWLEHPISDDRYNYLF